jgi:hypothetical protein
MAKKLSKQIKEMTQMLNNSSLTFPSAGSIDIELEDDEMGRDISAIKEMFSRKYLFDK